MSEPYLVDARKLVAGGAALVVAVAVAAIFVWMTPRAAAREVRAACDGLRADPGNDAVGQIPVEAPDFAAQAHDGKLVHLSDFRGKVVLVNFWASWCKVCGAEKSSLAAMTRELAQDDFVVVTLASNHAWDDVKQSLPGGAPFNVLLDPPTDVGRPGPADDDNIGAIATSFGVKAVPESFLIDKKGVIRMYMANKRDWDSQVAETCLQAMIDE
jgi:peroxiredoxin